LEFFSSPALKPWVPGTPSQGVKQPEHEVDQSPPSDAEVKDVWSSFSTHPSVFMLWCIVKYRNVFMTWYLVKPRDFILP